MTKEKADALWKEIIEDLFQDFVKFFLPDLYPHIDFTKGYTFLDEELANIIKKISKGKKIADRLVKVYFKDGTENWILIHVEIQGYYEEDFALRMFKYFYRIFDKYNKKIVALAIFTENKKDYKPNKYKYDFFRTKLEYEYITYKILEQDEKQLISSDNPFALVILAGLYTIKSLGKKAGNQRFIFKFNLTKLLLQKKYNKEKIIRILKFLDGLLFLPDELEIKFSKDIEQFIGGGEKKMGITMEMTNIYQVGVHQGEEKGREKGREEEKLILFIKFTGKIKN